MEQEFFTFLPAHTCTYCTSLMGYWGAKIKYQCKNFPKISYWRLFFEEKEEIHKFSEKIQILRSNLLKMKTLPSMCHTAKIADYGIWN